MMIFAEKLFKNDDGWEQKWTAEPDPDAEASRSEDDEPVRTAQDRSRA